CALAAYEPRDLRELRVRRSLPAQDDAALSVCQTHLYERRRGGVVMEPEGRPADVARLVRARTGDCRARVVGAGIGSGRATGDSRGLVGAGEGDRERAVVPTVRIRGPGGSGLHGRRRLVDADSYSVRDSC